MTEENLRCRADDPPYVTVELVAFSAESQQDPVAFEHLGDPGRHHPGVIERVQFKVQRRRIIADAVVGVLLCSLPLLLQLVVPKSGEPGKPAVAATIFTSCSQSDNAGTDGVRYVTPLDIGDSKPAAVPVVFQPCPKSAPTSDAGFQVVLPVPVDSGKKTSGPVIYTPCSPTEGLDARVLVLIVTAAIGAALFPRLLRQFSESTVSRPTISATTNKYGARYVDSHRAVLGHRRFGILVGGTTLAVAWLTSLYGAFSGEWVTTIINAGGLKFCDSPQYVAAFQSMWNAPFHAALLPWITFAALGAVAAVLLGCYAGLRPSESKTVSGIRQKYFTKWIQNSLSGSMQRQLLLEQDRGQTPAHPLTQSRYQSVSHWLRMAYVFSAHCSRTPDSKRAKPDAREVHLPERTFWRIVIAPIAAPFCATLLAPLVLWASGADVAKPQYLAGIVVWAGWTTYYLARIALGTTIKFQRLLASQPGTDMLFLSLPVSNEMRRSMQRYDAYHLGAYVNVVLTVLLALMVGWVGAF